MNDLVLTKEQIKEFTEKLRKDINGEFPLEETEKKQDGEE